MGVTVPPEMFEDVANTLGDCLAYADFDVLLYMLTGDRAINALANRDWPPRRVAREVLDYIEREGLTERFLHRVLARRPGDEPLHQLLLRVAPRLAASPGDARQTVEAVVTGLDLACDRLDDPAIRQAIDVSRATIASLAVDVEALRAYKELHDSLHQIQVRRFADLRRAARAMADPDQIGRLREFLDQIRTPIADAGLALDAISDTGVERATERQWVERLSQFWDRLQDAVDRTDRSLAAMSLAGITNLLAIEPPRINRLIFLAATRLPLNVVADALVAIDDAAGGEPALAATADQLRQLRGGLVIRVATHNLWQQADDGLVALDQMLGQSPATALEDFMLGWDQSRRDVATLINAEPDATWAQKATRYAAAVEDRLAKVEPMVGAATDPTVLAVARDELAACFAVFAAEARFQFFAVDRALLRDCKQLLRIGDPLRRILERLDND
jgi:hypothetical protein